MSKINIILHPDFLYLQKFVENVPFCFDKEGIIIYQGRNILKWFHIEETDLIIKAFKPPIFFNRIAYTFFRKSKARRSYEHAIKLLDKKCLTPAPVAYIEIMESGLLKRSFYISLYNKESIHTRDYMDGSKQDDELLKAFAKFTADIHAKGIYHIDYSPGNILVNQLPDLSFTFSLIDINRLAFKELSQEEKFHNFERLCVSKQASTTIAYWYAFYSGIDKNFTIQKINEYGDRFFERKACSWAKKNIKKQEGKWKSICGPIQKYQLYRAIRWTFFRKKKDSELYIKEKDLYEKYIRHDDKRQVLKNKYDY